MEQIDIMLDQWIHSTHIRARLRELIVEAIDDGKKDTYKWPKPCKTPFEVDTSDWVDEDED
tara:strand:+ start:222 stop:404 length:183 start_codon:yes stop_codon:yes gene_type:complete